MQNVYFLCPVYDEWLCTTKSTNWNLKDALVKGKKCGIMYIVGPTEFQRSLNKAQRRTTPDAEGVAHMFGVEYEYAVKGASAGGVGHSPEDQGQ